MASVNLNLLLSCLSNRKQRTNVNSSYSDWYDIIRGVPQGSILGSLLFNLFINDLFIFLERGNLCNFADDNTIYRGDSVSEIILEDLQHDMKILLNWFKISLMKPKSKKVQFFIFVKSSRLPVTININNIKIRESQKVMLLGLTIDNCLNFKGYIDTLCRQASYNFHASQRIRKHLTLDKAKVLCNDVINSQFSYVSIISENCF